MGMASESSFSEENRVGREETDSPRLPHRFADAETIDQLEICISRS
jgi:hypothetical protein